MTSPLEALGYPLFFRVGDAGGAALDAPEPRLGQSHRARFRALDTMQKEALVTGGVSGATWRLASDEGEYFDGADVAPAPLALFATGAVCAYATAIRAVADERGVDVRDLALDLDCYFTVSGSLLRGTMSGGALPFDLDVRLDGDADESALRDLVATATRRSPIRGVVTGEHPSAFALSVDGEAVETGREAGLDVPVPPERPDPFEVVGRDAVERDPPLVVRTGESIADRPDAATRPLREYGADVPQTDDRTLRVRATCAVDDDGRKRVDAMFDTPAATIFELRSDEPEGRGGRGRAPDAATYLAAGVGFCFMTQAARYAERADVEVTDLRLVQDLHLSDAVGAATDGPGRAAPVQTHASIRTPGGAPAARDVLDAAEEMCFAHALFGTPLDPPSVEVVTR